MDLTILHAMNGFLIGRDSLEDPLLTFVSLSEALFLATLAVICVLARGEQWRSWRRAAVAAGLSAGLGLAAGTVISDLVDRARPFVTHPEGIHLFAPHAADASFPSDHATAAMAIAVAILLRHRRWGLIALAAALIVSVGRIALGYHYPSDVLAGVLLGTGAALLLWTPPLRRAVDAVSDTVGDAWDAVLERGGRALSRR